MNHASYQLLQCFLQHPAVDKFSLSFCEAVCVCGFELHSTTLRLISQAVYELEIEKSLIHMLFLCSNMIFWSGQNLANATKSELSWHTQNYDQAVNPLRLNVITFGQI